MPLLPLPLAFAAAQFAFSAVVLVVYSIGALASRKVRVSKGLSERASSHTEAQGHQGGVLATFAAQAVLKLVLAEGDKAAAAVLLSNQGALGVYALASGVGSLAVRTVLAPFEEAAFFAFTRCRKKGEVDVLRATLLRVLLLAGIFCCGMSPSYAYVVLRGLYGAAWAQADVVRALAAFGPLFALLAVNGILEAAADADGSALQLRQRLVVLVASAVVQAVVGALLVRSYGPTALVMGNIAGYCLRIAAQGGLRRCTAVLPSLPTVLVLATLSVAAAASDFILQRSSTFWRSAGLHCAVGIVLAVCFVGAVARWDGEALRESFKASRD